MAIHYPLPLLALFLIASAILSVGHSTEEPTFTQCRVHIEAAIKAGGVPTENESPSETLLESHDSGTEAELIDPPQESTSTIEVEHVEETEQPVENEVEAGTEESDGGEQPIVHEEQGDADSDEGEEVDDDTEPEETQDAEDEEEQPSELEDEGQNVSEEEAEPEEVEAPPTTEETTEENVVVTEEPLPEVEIQAPESQPEPQQEQEPVQEELVVETQVPEVSAEAPQEQPPAEEPTVVEATTVEVTVEEQPTAVAVETENPAEGIIEEEPAEKRSRDHITRILRLAEDLEGDMMRDGVVVNILKDLKKLVENSVRSLENIFKYNDVSNRNFGDPEIFSKPLVLFLGPWSGGKSSIINYLLGTEFTQNALKTGAEPSATFFQILMYGETEEKLDGTQLAADWTFSGLQKFGQAFIDRLRGRRLPSRILERVNIVEVPGILEVRKQVDRPYPFNDVVQWFIDRADVIFVVYDPTKLDTGIEHEALFDQLKGRQNQVRVLLNKADSVTQEELLLIQNNLVWNLSPLMASPLPPTLYAGSFWSVPYKQDAPVRLLKAHEENMLQDLRETMDNVIENTIAEARRHAVRVRNHAKMVDCYLTTFFNQKGYFGNKKAVAEDIVENPHAYHIFEGLSTLSNISRYDLPDAEVYKDFFRLHPLYEFKPLAATCSFFRGCPLDKLDTAIAYDLPELVGKYKKRLQAIAAGKAKKAGH